ncbi:MAG: hypothetical protein J0L58_19340, partial [Burkholderiales bacterium]|nr:hypothetical protein [Burkholderiales bacterium]
MTTPPDLSLAQALNHAQALHWSGRQPEAEGLCTAALAAPTLPAPQQLALLELRSEIRFALGRFAEALADADAMLKAAKKAQDATGQSRAQS